MTDTASSQAMPGGIAGNILRVDLTNKKIWTEQLTPAEWRMYVGGAALGAKILYEEVPAEVEWDHPENRLIMATGPLAGMPVWGTGGLTVVTRGAMTNGATSTQANGFFGANLKYSGYDAIVFQGQSPEWVYLYVHDDQVELRAAKHLLGQDTWEVQDSLHEETGLQGHRLSVYSIGPAGENLVRFAAIAGDYGHVASKNGCGAVLGSKRVKAVALVRGSKALKPHDAKGCFRAADVISHALQTNPTTNGLYRLGTLSGVFNNPKIGMLPIRNYSTNVVPEGVDMSRWEGQALRDGFDHRGHQCNSCGMHHCHQVVIPKGHQNAGEIVDEPEYEGWSAGWAMGVTNREDQAYINTRLDRACLDCNESGWLIGWVMECYEKGYLTKEQLDGLEPKWGDKEVITALINKISNREGVGNLLAEGVKRASEQIGGEAADIAIYTMKGNTPRGHDHRARWEEMLDTCVGSGGTIETGPATMPTELGRPARINPRDPEEVPRNVGGLLGRRHFEDCIGTCLFTTRTKLANICLAVNAATGWDMDTAEAIKVGKRVSALMRAFNIRCGIGPELERPSKRYGSIPVDGPVAGKGIDEHWESMITIYYELARYDRATGKPQEDLLRELGLDSVANDMWGA